MLTYITQRQLGYSVSARRLGLTPETDPTVAIDSPDGSLVFFLQEVPEPKTVKNCMHVDVRLRDQAHLDELLRLGATGDLRA